MIPLLFVVMFVLVICLFAYTYVSQQILMVYNQTPIFTNSSYQIKGHPNAYNATKQVMSNYYGFDLYLSFFFWGVFIVAIIASGWLNSHPLSYVVGYLMMFFFIYFSMLLSNLSKQVFTSAIFGNVPQMFPNLLNIFANFGLYNWIFLVISLLAIAARTVITKNMNGGG